MRFSAQFTREVSMLVTHMTLWNIARQAPPSVKFCREEYWTGLPSPSPGDLLDPGIKPGSPTLWADSLPSEPGV